MNNYVFLEYKGENNSIAVMRISRPESLNALNEAVIRQIDEQLDKLEKDNCARALILTGEKHFAAGADIDVMVNFTPKQAVDFAFMPVYSRIENLNIPTIAAVSGYALGGGFELALCCDFRLGSEDAVVGLPEINLGIIPGGGGTVRLPRLIGEAKAKELIYFGKNIKADKALSYGIFAEVTERETLMDRALELAEKLSEKSKTALSAAKRMIQANCREEDYSRERMEWGLLFDTDDQKEGMSAFLNK